MTIPTSIPEQNFEVVLPLPFESANLAVSSLMSLVYQLGNQLQEGKTRWLVEFAGDCLEAALFEHDETTPKQLLTKLLREYLAELEVEKEDQG